MCIRLPLGPLILVVPFCDLTTLTTLNLKGLPSKQDMKSWRQMVGLNKDHFIYLNS